MDTWREADESARHHLRCPLCGNLELDREEGRIDSRWGVTSHKVVMMVLPQLWADPPVHRRQGRFRPRLGQQSGLTESECERLAFDECPTLEELRAP